MPRPSFFSASVVPVDRFEAESWLKDPPWSSDSGEQYPVGRTVVSRCKNGSSFKDYSAYLELACDDGGFPRPEFEDYGGFGDDYFL